MLVRFFKNYIIYRIRGQGENGDENNTLSRRTCPPSSARRALWVVFQGGDLDPQGRLGRRAEVSFLPLGEFLKLVLQFLKPKMTP